MANADFQSEAERYDQIAKRALQMMAGDERLPFVSAFVMASDKVAGEVNLDRLRRGELTLTRALLFTGSYGRLDLLLAAYDNGLAIENEVLDGLIEWWSGSDPDDTDPRFLTLWKRAWERNHNRFITDPDGTDLPMRRRIRIYRGQDLDAPIGIAWSTSSRVARKFANGAATRQVGRGGVVLTGTVNRTDILAYLTDRHENEVIVDPDTVEIVR
jgi:hypothetical protein